METVAEDNGKKVTKAMKRKEKLREKTGKNESKVNAVPSSKKADGDDSLEKVVEEKKGRKEKKKRLKLKENGTIGEADSANANVLTNNDDDDANPAVKVTEAEAKREKKKKRKSTEESAAASAITTTAEKEEPPSKKKKKLEGILKMKNVENGTAQPPPPPPPKDCGDDVVEELLTNPSFQPRVDAVTSADGVPKTKRDKMRRKKEERKATKATAQEARKNEAGEAIRVLEAKEYLRTWKRKRETWKFNKTRQTWLLKNLFATDALDDEAFGIALEYLRPLKGKAREETTKQAEAKVDEEGVSFLQAERARLVAQMLA